MLRLIFAERRRQRRWERHFETLRGSTGNLEVVEGGWMEVVADDDEIDMTCRRTETGENEGG